MCESLQLNKGRMGRGGQCFRDWKRAVFGDVFDALVEGKSPIKDDGKVSNIRWVSTAEPSIQELWVDDLMRDLGTNMIQLLIGHS